ncbi:unnamed protein product [marine sediment metagenome]|uniref:Uncharacterized protein n=1 Tax=marine sediment metagenome TaxID=412755 RepID=X1EX40_9ZZZZ
MSHEPVIEKDVTIHSQTSGVDRASVRAAEVQVANLGPLQAKTARKRTSFESKRKGNPEHTQVDLTIDPNALDSYASMGDLSERCWIGAQPSDTISSHHTFETPRVSGCGGVLFL